MRKMSTSDNKKRIMVKGTKKHRPAIEPCNPAYLAY